MKMTVQEIATACGGRLLCGDGGAQVTWVCTDSRQVKQGALFVPIKGERTDAHQFLPAVLEAGAAAVLTQEHSCMDGDQAWIAVEDTGEALQKIAAAYRARFTLPLVGITGSVGKTTTKEMVALALSSGLNVMKTEGNFNSQIGLPLTMFRLEPEHRAAVIEMGMSNFGEMDRLAQIARPECAVVTNIGLSHIEYLKTQQNIRTEKLHITDCFHEGSVLFLNGDDPLLAELKGTLPYSCVFFGTKDFCDYRAEAVESDGISTTFTLCARDQREPMTIPVLGIHNVYNALAAVAVAEHLGLSRQGAKKALEAYEPLAMRQQIHRVKGISVVDDSYNASPDSMRSSIDVLMSLNTSGKTVGVFADMLELGDQSEQAHFESGVYAAQAGITELVTIGAQAEKIAQGALSVRPDLKCLVCHSNGEATEYLLSALKSGDAVAVKGSRGMKTDEIVKRLLQL